MSAETLAPVLFISYSWTSPDHEAYVLHLAERLQGDGISVRIDKWDLREGHDANAFMESMVTDPAVKKVALLVDEAYAKKADARAGGGGTEAQIITAGLYGKTTQDKFVAVVLERDSSGAPSLPTYYKGAHPY